MLYPVELRVRCFPKDAFSRQTKDGAPGEIRTPDLTVRSRSLYPTELRAPKIILLQGLRKSLCPASSTSSTLDGDSSLGMAFIPQWIKNTSAFGLVLFFSPDDHLDCSPGSGSFTGWVGICHLFATYMGKLGAKRKKNLVSAPKIPKK